MGKKILWGHHPPWTQNFVCPLEPREITFGVNTISQTEWARGRACRSPPPPAASSQWGKLVPLGVPEMYLDKRVLPR
jgi:hypothetical protein